MPWEVKKQGSKYLVVKQDGGKVVGTHDSEASANAQLEALYANVKEAAEGMWFANLLEGRTPEQAWAFCEGLMFAMEAEIRDMRAKSLGVGQKPRQLSELKQFYNKNHAADGRFSSGSGGGGFIQQSAGVRADSGGMLAGNGSLTAKGRNELADKVINGTRVGDKMEIGVNGRTITATRLGKPGQSPIDAQFVVEIKGTRTLYPARYAPNNRELVTHIEDFGHIAVAGK